MKTEPRSRTKQAGCNLKKACRTNRKNEDAGIAGTEAARIEATRIRKNRKEEEYE